MILLHSVEWLTFVAEGGEIAIIMEIYDADYKSKNIYDCRIKLGCGGELDVWFGEICSLKGFCDA